MDMFELSALPYDFGDSSAGGIDFGDFNWSDPSLSSLGALDFVTPGYGSGDSEQPGRIDQTKLADWLKQKNYGLFDRGLPGNMGERFLYDKTKNQMVGNPQILNYNEGPAWDLASAFAGSILNPLASPLAGGGIGGAFGLSGGAQTAANAAAMGGMNTAAQGGGLKDIFKSGAISGITSGAGPDLAGPIGVTNKNLGNAINQGARGAVAAELSGGDWKSGAVSGAVPGLANYVGESFMPQNDQFTGGFSRGTAESNPTFSQQYLGEPIPEMSLASSPYMSSFNVSGFNPGIGGPEPATPSFSDNFKQILSSVGLNSPERFGDLAGGLLGMYSGYKRRRMAKELMGQIGGNRAGYEANLRRELQARDAAAGRRSDYAGRAAQVQSKLAEIDSRNAPALAQLQNMSYSGLEGMFGSGLRMAGKMGWFGSGYQQPGVYTPPPSLPSLSQSMPTDPYSFSLDQFKRRLGGGQ